MRKTRMVFVKSILLLIAFGCFFAQGLSGREKVDDSIRAFERNINSHINFRLADPQDLGQILALYDGMSADDEDKLIIIPEKFREGFIAEALKENRIFVAEDTKTKCVVAFVKLFLIKKKKEAKSILKNELRCLSADRKLQKYGVFGIHTKEIDDFSKGLPYFDIDTFGQYHQFAYNESQASIYYGCSYTAAAYRGKGISSQLDRYALSVLKKEVLEYIQKHNSQELLFIYGQVATNAHHQSPIRSFADFVRNIKNKQEDTCIHLIYWSYRALKPTFFVNAVTGELCVLEEPLSNWDDFGCIISYSLLEN